MKTDIKAELDIVRKALKDDRELYYTWQSNIAMAFYDEVKRQRLHLGNNRIMKEISNTAAENFLQNLIND